MDYLTVKNDRIITTPESENPIINPAGPLPTETSISIGNAASQASSAASTPNPFLALDNGPGPKNIFFLAVIGFLIWKYGRKVF